MSPVGYNEGEREFLTDDVALSWGAGRQGRELVIDGWKL